MAETKIAVTVSVPDPDRFDDVLALAKRHGLQVDQVFPPLGVATGAVAEPDLELLRALPGIGSVEEQRRYNVSRKV